MEVQQSHKIRYIETWWAVEPCSVQVAASCTGVPYTNEVFKHGDVQFGSSVVLLLCRQPAQPVQSDCHLQRVEEGRGRGYRSVHRCDAPVHDVSVS